jgi:hypothetical protein
LLFQPSYSVFAVKKTAKKLKPVQKNYKGVNMLRILCGGGPQKKQQNQNNLIMGGQYLPEWQNNLDLF